MKKLIILFIFFPVLALGQAKLKGFATPKAAVEAFTSPLKKGSKGVADSLSAVDTLNGDSSTSNSEELNSTLTKDLKDNGKLVRATYIDSDERLNGNMQVMVYELEFLNGRKRQVEFKLIKPSQNAGFHVMGIKLD